MGAALVTSFTEFTDTVGIGTCGNRAYTLSFPDTSIASAITLGSPRDLTIATVDMSIVGEFQVIINVALASYPELTQYIGFAKTVNVVIENRCLSTHFV